MRAFCAVAGWVLVIVGSALMISPIPFGFILIGAGSALIAASKRRARRGPEKHVSGAAPATPPKQLETE